MRSKKEVILEAQRDKQKVHFATLMDICHLKNAEFEPKLQKYKGRVVLCGDIVKHDSGAYAVFTEQGSSASQMAAAKIMDVIARLPGCAGQATDAVSAYTQAKLEDAPRLLKSLKSECPDVWIRLARHKLPKSRDKIEDPVVPLERNFSRSSISQIAMGKTIRRSFIGTWVGENSELGIYVLSSETKVIVCQYTWMTSKSLEGNRIWLFCGKIDEKM